MRNAIIRFCAIVALLGFGNEIRAVRSGGHLFLLNDSISPDENNGKVIEEYDSIRAAHALKENAVVYASKDTLDLGQVVMFSLYLCTTIPKRYIAWSICTGNNR